MNVTLTLADDLVKEVRKIAVERDTTLTGLIRAYLQELAADGGRSTRQRQEREALIGSFKGLQVNVGKRTWKREDLHERGTRGPAVSADDPLLALRGSGRALWSDEHADEYVRRLREGWA